MSAAEIEGCAPRRLEESRAQALERAHQRMADTGQWSARQQMGRRWPVGCVALEVTQRCNLDCTLCYLSESSQALGDPPLEEIFRRIAMIRAQYGAGTDVQITGGEPTLRPARELVSIVRRVRAAGLRPSLFTNGIRATRALLAELARAGLEDVAFHVDFTQQRRGFATEEALHALRAEYIERARGLPLAVFFNTSICAQNLDAVPGIAKFFLRHADTVRTASFQLHADTGRGVLRGRGPRVSVAAVAERVRAGLGCALDFDVMDIGHARCNRYAMALAANGRAYDLLDEPAFILRVLDRTAAVRLDRARPARSLARFAAQLGRDPRLLLEGLGWAARKVWRMRRDLAAARGRVHKLSFFIHDFMHACALERDRIEACSFMVATRDGPLSMCLHNAKRDAYLLPPGAAPVLLTRKTARGLARLRLESAA